MTATPPVLTPASPSAPRTSGLAIWSLVLGILSIFCLWILGSIPAIIMGSIAIKQANERPQEIGGKGLALAGIITGGVGILTGLVTVGVYAGMMIPALSGAQVKAEEARAMNSARMISFGLTSYALDHNESFPATLEELVPDYLPTAKDISQTNPDTDESSLFLYRAGLKSDGDPSTPILLSPYAIGGKRIVVYLDSRVESLREPLPPELETLFE